MKLSKPVKLVLGALTALPIIYMAFFFCFFVATFLSISDSVAQAEEPSSGMRLWFTIMFAAHLATMLLMFALLTFYIVFLFKTERVSQDVKVLWAVVLFLGSPLAMPIFFYVYVWPEAWPKTA